MKLENRAVCATSYKMWNYCRLLQLRMVDAEVSERMRGDDVAKRLETTEAELMHAVFPHRRPPR